MIDPLTLKIGMKVFGLSYAYGTWSNVERFTANVVSWDAETCAVLGYVPDHSGFGSETTISFAQQTGTFQPPEPRIEIFTTEAECNTACREWKKTPLVHKN